VVQKVPEVQAVPWVRFTGFWTCRYGQLDVHRWRRGRGMRARGFVDAPTSASLRGVPAGAAERRTVAVVFSGT